MIKIFYKVLAIVICSITLIGNAFAQELYPTQPQQEKECEVGEFTAVCVTSNFQVVLQEGRCGVTLTGDEALLPYYQVSVRDSILYIEYDEKAVPREVKKIYRGRNAPVPIMKASVSSPVLNGIVAKDNAVISGKGLIFSDTLDMLITDKALVNDLKLDTENAKLRMTKNAQANFNLSAESQLELSLEGNSQLKLQHKSRNLLLHQEGSSTAILDGESSTATYDIAGYAKNRSTGKGNVLVVKASGNADVSLAGQMGDLTLNIDRSAKLDAVEMPANRVIVSQNGWNTAVVNAQEFLGVDLTGGCTLQYVGIPAIQVDKIMKSTLVHIEENK